MILWKRIRILIRSFYLFMHKARTFPVWALLLSKVYVSLDISFLRYGKIYFRSLLINQNPFFKSIYASLILIYN